MADRAICSVEGCDKGSVKRDYCEGHYKRWWRYGDPKGGRATNYREATHWLESHATFDGNDCLPWPFSMRADGYGSAQVGDMKMRASRAMCIVAHGEPPTSDHEAAHSCGRGHEGCVNPRHLRWATPKENSTDRVKHGNSLRGELQPRAKLTAEQVVSIRRDMAHGMASRKVAEAYGISRRTVNDIAQRRRWAWLP